MANSTMVTLKGVRYRVEDAVARGLLKPESARKPEQAVEESEQSDSKQEDSETEEAVKEEPGKVEEPKKAPPRANKAVKPADKASK